MFIIRNCRQTQTCFSEVKNDHNNYNINCGTINDTFINWFRCKETLMWYLFREIGNCKVGLLMGKYETKTEARMDKWQYELFTNYKYNIIKLS